MRWVDRGKPPRGLGQIKLEKTLQWIAFYRDGVGARPNDASWRLFRSELSSRFSGICGYCEERDRGEVDHFKPKSKFPELVYEWTNWVFACHTCNSIYKREKWPQPGYIDPCTALHHERPERVFDFDTHDGSIVVRQGLNEEIRSRAQQTIDDLGLNELEHLQKRIARIELIELLIHFLRDSPNAEGERFIYKLMSSDTELSSLTERVLQNQDWYHGHDDQT